MGLWLPDQVQPINAYPEARRGIDGTPAWAYDEDGYCVCCGNGLWKYHMPECELRDALDARVAAMVRSAGRPRLSSSVRWRKATLVPVHLRVEGDRVVRRAGGSRTACGSWASMTWSTRRRGHVTCDGCLEAAAAG